MKQLSFLFTMLIMAFNLNPELPKFDLNSVAKVSVPKAHVQKKSKFF